MFPMILLNLLTKSPNKTGLCTVKTYVKRPLSKRTEHTAFVLYEHFFFTHSGKYATIRESNHRSGHSGKSATIRESNHGSRCSIMRSTKYQKAPFCSPEMAQ